MYKMQLYQYKMNRKRIENWKKSREIKSLDVKLNSLFHDMQNSTNEERLELAKAYNAANLKYMELTGGPYFPRK